MSNRTLLRVWTPDDAAALRAVCDEFPRTVAQSPALADLMDDEGLS